MLVASTSAANLLPLRFRTYTVTTPASTNTPISMMRPLLSLGSIKTVIPTGILAAGVYSVTASPAWTGYVTGQTVRFVTNADNAGAVQVNINSNGPNNLQSIAGTNFNAGDIPAGSYIEATYDGSQFIANIKAPGSDYPIVTSTAHRLYDGDSIIIAGASISNFNGKFKVEKVLTRDTFTIKVAGAAGLGDPAGTITARQLVMAQRAMFIADAANTQQVNIGPDYNADFDGPAAGKIYTIPEMPIGAKFDLADWYAKSSAATQALRVLYV